jgi:hypothetical protein
MRTWHVSFCVFLLCWSTAGARLVLYETGFEHGGSFPPGWAVESHDVGDDWYMAGSPTNYFPEVRGAPTGPQDEWLISSLIDCTGHADITLQYTFYFRDWPYEPPDSGLVHISTDGGATWPSENLVALYAGSSQGGTASIDISAIAGEQSQVRVRWRYVGDFGYTWWIDDVKIIAGVEKDTGVMRFEGPAPGSVVRAGAEIAVYARVANYGTSTQHDVPIQCTIEPGGYTGQAQIDSLGPGEDALVRFEPSWEVGAAGASYTLSASTLLPGDEDPSNDPCEIGPLPAVDVPVAAEILVLYNGEADSTAYAEVLASTGSQSDFWHTGRGALYDLEPWLVVALAEAEAYPCSSVQFAVMRFADGAAPEAPRGLLVSGDRIGQSYDTGAVIPEFYRHYLRATFGGEFGVYGDSLVYGVPGDPLGGAAPADVLPLTMHSPDIIVGPPEEPPPIKVYVYRTPTGTDAAAIRHSGGGCNTLYLGFEFGQIHPGAARDALWERAEAWLRGDLEIPSNPRHPDVGLRLQVYPQPTHGSVTIRTSPEARTCRIYDLRGMLVTELLPTGPSARWDGTDATGQDVAPGPYVILAEAGHSAATERFLLIR